MIITKKNKTAAAIKMAEHEINTWHYSSGDMLHIDAAAERDPLNSAL